MEDIVYVSSFDPVTNEDVKVISKIDAYLSFAVSSVTIALLKDSLCKEEIHHRKAMLQRAFPKNNIVVINESIHSLEALHSIFPGKKIIAPYHYLRSICYGFLSRDGEVTLLTSGMEMLEHPEKKYQCLFSKIPYEGKMQEENLQKGMYLDAPVAVLDYLSDNELYFCSELLKREGITRYRHSVSVAKTAYQIGLNANLNPYLCYQMGLFHDCAKRLSYEENMRIMQKQFPQYLPCPEYAMHQFSGAYLAKTYFHLPSNVYTPILFHCTGRGEMTQMDKCLFVADKVEPTRFYETKAMRELSLVDLDRGFISVLENLVEHFKEKKVNFLDNALSIEMYRQYLNIGESSC